MNEWPYLATALAICSSPACSDQAVSCSKDWGQRLCCLTCSCLCLSCRPSYAQLVCSRFTPLKLLSLHSGFLHHSPSLQNRLSCLCTPHNQSHLLFSTHFFSPWSLPRLWFYLSFYQNQGIEQATNLSSAFLLMSTFGLGILTCLSLSLSLVLILWSALNR